MLLLKCLVIACVILYLWHQALIDSKTGYVYKLLNTVAVVLSFVIWIATICYHSQNMINELVTTALLMIVLFLSTLNLPIVGKVMQPADAKAFAVVYFTSAFSMSIFFAPLILLLTMIVGHTIFLVWHRVIKKTERGNRKPYFPFILLGYLSSVLFYVILYCISIFV